MCYERDEQNMPVNNAQVDTTTPERKQVWMFLDFGGHGGKVL
jgi:hypothetical protein